MTERSVETPRGDRRPRPLRPVLVAAGVVVAVAIGLAWVVNIDHEDQATGVEAPSLSGTESRADGPAGSSMTTALPDGSTSPGRDCPSGSRPTRAKLGQLVMIGVDPAATAAARAAVEVQGAGGVFIGGNPTDLLTSGTLSGLRAPGGVMPFVAVDDEGGRVQRIDAIVGDLPSAREMAANLSPVEATELARARGQELLRLGVTVNFAPVVDVSNQGDREVIGDRSFGDDADSVTTYARAFAVGLSEAGVLPVYKHFPGHGHADADSHLGTATTPHLDDLEADLAPYRHLLDGSPPAAVMVGHLVVPGLTDGHPASMSRAAVTGLLREQLGFDGLVFTDDLSGMRAINDQYTPAEAAVQAINAGADVALIAGPIDVGALLDGLEQALDSGALDATSVERSFRRVMVTKGYDC